MGHGAAGCVPRRLRASRAADGRAVDGNRVATHYESPHREQPDKEAYFPRYRMIDDDELEELMVPSPPPPPRGAALSGRPPLLQLATHKHIREHRTSANTGPLRDVVRAPRHLSPAPVDG